MDYPKPNFIMLIILDGWGLAPSGPGNPITQANLPNMNKYWNTFPHTQLVASGEAVGLPRGEAGNSETGHLNLGAGQIVYQDLPRINLAIADGTFFTNSAFIQAACYVQKNHSVLHLMGLVGGGGVHANNEHLFALLRLAKEQKLPNVVLHLFTDGRDSPPTAALTYIAQIKRKMEELNIGKIGSVMGRYWAMDRDNRWSRTEKAYLALTEGKGEISFSPEEAIQKSYEAGKTDEFILPTIIVDQSKTPIGLIDDSDAVIFYNFRIDRPRQLTKAFVLENFSAEALKKAFDPYADKYVLTRENKDSVGGEPPFTRNIYLPNLFFVTMTEYEKDLPVEAVAFPPQQVALPLARVLADNGFRQLHICETEKERFVTYYFNGFREQPFPGEDWLIIPSAKVATYDLLPEMSAKPVTQKIVEKISQETYQFILVNYANPDMVGHTAKLEACIKALETVDDCLGQLMPLVLSQGGAALITADHGNIEEIINKDTGEVDTEHSANPVPFILISPNISLPTQLSRGILADVAPTILKLFQLPKPSSMTGKSLV
jgi:2,3-bisphosphoglycerate-independent phosphoglycerate mutase